MRADSEDPRPAAQTALVLAPESGAGVGPRSLAALMRRWPVGEATGSARLAEGLMNRNHRVDTPAGPLFLKQFLDVGRGQIAFQHRVTAALAAAGLPVPPPIPACDGRTLVTVRGRRFALCPWVPGRHRRGRSCRRPNAGSWGGCSGACTPGCARLRRRSSRPCWCPPPTPARDWT
ncbi:MAG: phosphotransferase enzyme family protein [Gemmatimonadales bacterium]